MSLPHLHAESPRGRSRYGGCAGFTMIELLVTLAIAALVMSFAVPSFQVLTNNNRMAVQTNDFIAALNLARSEAVKRRQTAVMCIETTAGGACASNNDQWENGWTIFVDSDNDGVIDDDEIIRKNGALNSSNTLRGSLFGSTGQISYDSRGRLQGNDSGTFTLCDKRGANYAKTINVNGTGRAGFSSDGNDIQGGAVQCPST